MTETYFVRWRWNCFKGINSHINRETAAATTAVCNDTLKMATSEPSGHQCCTFWSFKYWAELPLSRLGDGECDLSRSSHIETSNNVQVSSAWLHWNGGHACVPTVQSRKALMSPYISEFIVCDSQQTGLKGVRVCVCMHFWCMLCSLTQTLRWADRSVTQQKCQVLLKPASSAERAHTENGETEMENIQKRPSRLQKCPLHFFLSFTYSGVMNNRGVLVLSPSPS